MALTNSMNRGTLVFGEEDKCMPVSPSKRRANDKYDASHCRQVKMKLNINTDADILAKFDEEENVTGYIKALVRADLKKVKKPKE